jgi:competence protein ComEC
MAWRAGRLVLLFFGALAATSLIAGLATTVFGVWHFQRVSPLALAANLAAMPVVSLVVMPAAVAGSLLVPLGLDGPFFAAMGWGLRLVMAIAHFLSERSPLDSVGAIPAAALVLLACALAVATIATTATLRLLAVPLAVAGLAAALSRDLPDALVSEDGRLVAVATADGRLAVNRARPSGFTIGNWQHAMAANGIVRPEPTERADDISAAPGAGAGPQTGHAFRCGADKTCLARHAGGSAVAYAPDAATATAYCVTAALIVVDDATAQNPCAPGSPAAVVTRRDLALRGSAAVWLDGAGTPRIVFAIGDAPRIWHDQRRFSREARGLPPWQKRPPGTPSADAAPAGAAPRR